MKNEIRNNILDKRSNLSQNEILELSNKIYSNIINWTSYNQAKVIMIYYAFKNEVVTDDIIKHAFSTGKQVILPKSIKDGRRILPCRINSLDQLQRGNYGVMEPPADDIVEKGEIDVVFVPGVAYDDKGYRIGYGAGYYDRFLKDYEGIKSGVCFDLQLVEDAYPNEFDIPMDFLITENGIIKIGG